MSAAEDMSATSVDPLEMAENCVAAVERAARWQETDPLEARVHDAGRHGKTSAELAGHLALVSIARDLRRVVDRLMEEDRPEAKPEP